MTEPAPLVLGFDSSGPYCSALLLSGSEVLAERHQEMAKGQVEHLMPLLEDTLQDAGCQWADLTALGVGVGPGNFTGIRIAVSAARGLSLSLNIPAVGVPLMDCLALDGPRPMLASLDARRDMVYVQLFDGSGAGPIRMCKLDEVTASQANLTCIGERAGDIANKVGGVHKPAAYAPASAIARLAAQRFRDTKNAPTPLYIKPADAAPSKVAPPVILS